MSTRILKNLFFIIILAGFQSCSILYVKLDLGIDQVGHFDGRITNKINSTYELRGIAKAQGSLICESKDVIFLLSKTSSDFIAKDYSVGDPIKFYYSVIDNGNSEENYDALVGLMTFQ